VEQVFWEGCLEVGMGKEYTGVDACIGASAPGQFDRITQDRSDGFFQGLLYGRSFGLPLPASIAGSVVGQSDKITLHGIVRQLVLQPACETYKPKRAEKFVRDSRGYGKGGDAGYGFFQKDPGVLKAGASGCRVNRTAGTHVMPVAPIGSAVLGVFRVAGKPAHITKLLVSQAKYA
jgi:hypothetical protein